MQSNYDNRHLRARSGFIWVVGAFLVVALIALIFAVMTRAYYPAPTIAPYYGFPFFGWFFFPFGFIFFFFFLFFIARLFFWPWGWGWRRRYWYGYDDAHEILRQRFARGEITKEQFEQMKRDLEQH